MRSSDGLMAESSGSVRHAEERRHSGKRTAKRRSDHARYDQIRARVLADPELGKIGDKKIAKKHGVSETFVTKSRKDAGIESFAKKEILWTPEIEALLGVIPDTEIGRRFGIPKQTVCGRRTRAGIPPFMPPGRKRVAPLDTAQIFPLHYPRSKELRDGINEIKQQEITERMGLGWDVSACERIRHNRNYLWSARLRRAAIHSDGSYRSWIRNLLGRRVNLLGSQ